MVTTSANTKKTTQAGKSDPEATASGKAVLPGNSAPKTRDEERGCSLPGVLVVALLSRLSQGWSLWPLSVGLSSAPCSLPRLLWLPDSQGHWGVPRVLGPLVGAGRTGQRWC